MENEMPGLAPLSDPTLPQPQPMRPGNGIPTDIERVLGHLALLTNQKPVPFILARSKAMYSGSGVPYPELFIGLEMKQAEVERRMKMAVLKARPGGDIKVEGPFFIGDERL